MNYLSHAYKHLDNPYFVAGVALPDWLRVLGKEYRARRVHAERLRESPAWQDIDSQSFLAGIIQHHEDDSRFHSTETFIVLNAKLSTELRALHGKHASLRSHFLGHILIELLLDSILVDKHASLLEEYYAVIRSLDGERVGIWAEHLAGKPVPRFAGWVHRFCEERFLQDYGTDEGLLRRVNQILKRVGLPGIGSESLPWIASARVDVARHWEQLLEAA